MTERDPFDVLRAHLRDDAHGPSTGEPTGPAPDVLARRIIAGDIVAPPLQLSRRRRRRMGLAIVIGAAVATSGGLVAARILRVEHPRQAAAGVACRSTFSLGGSAWVLAPSDNPVAACTELWDHGELHQFEGAEGTPRLLACVTTDGVVDVVPAPPGRTCDDLGAATDDTAPVSGDLPLLVQDRLQQAIDNSCMTVPEATARAREVLDQLGLHNWKIMIGGTTLPCAVAGLTDMPETIVVATAFPPSVDLSPTTTTTAITSSAPPASAVPSPSSSP